MANENRLIYANALCDLLDVEYKRKMKLVSQGEIHLDNLAEGIMSVAILLGTMPTVDAVEVVHGRWFMRGGIFRCSECDSKALLKLDGNVGGCREYTHFRSNYCPNCGADMRERSEGE